MTFEHTRLCGAGAWPRSRMPASEAFIIDIAALQIDRPGALRLRTWLRRSAMTRKSHTPSLLARLLGLLALVCVQSFAHDPAQSASEGGIALDPGLGRPHHRVSTRNAQAQAYFDQGL